MARGIQITPEMDAYIHEHRLRLSVRDLAANLGISRNVLAVYMRNNNLVAPANVRRQFAIQKMTGKTTFTTAEDDKIRKEYLIKPVKTLAHEMNRSHTGIMGRLKALGLKIPKDVIDQRKKASQFKKGSTSFNKGLKQSTFMTKKGIKNSAKTRFKKGDLPHNTLPDGEQISVRHHKRTGVSYKFYRVKLSKWIPYHQHVWRKHNGPIPRGSIVVFKDGNTMNCELSNLELITRKENALRNRHKFNQLPEELKKTIRLTNKLNQKIKDYEQQSISA